MSGAKKLRTRAIWTMLAVIGLGILVYFLMAQPLTNATPGNGGATAPEALPVVTTLTQERLFERTLEVQGNVAAKNFALVPSVVGGTIEDFHVEEGDAVKAGETALFSVDSLKLSKAVEVKKLDCSVADCALREKEAYREQILAELEKAKLDLARFEQLYERKAVPLDSLEQQQTRFRQVRAQAKHADSLVDLASEQVRQADAALAIAEKDLADTTCVAPISGTVSGRFYELGELAESGKPVFRIDDCSLIEISAFLPAEYYPQVKQGETAASIGIYGQDAGRHVVTYKSPTISPALRTFEIRFLIEDPPSSMAPGALADVRVVLEKREGLGVPTPALQLRRSGSVVFTVEDARAHMHAVQPGIVSDGWTELLDSPLTKGVPVVVMGQSQIDDGSAVTIRDETAAAEDEG